MPVTINKAKAKAKAKSQNKTQLAEMVDQMGELSVQIDKVSEKLAPLQKQYSKVQAEFLDIMEDTLEADQTATIEGDEWEMTVGMKGNSSEVTENEAAFKMLDKIEKGLPWVLLKFGITELRKYLTPKQFEMVSLTTRSRKRTTKLEKL